MCTCKYFWLKVWLSFGPSPSRVRPSLSAQMASGECTCTGCSHCQSWINTTVGGHTYRTCGEAVAKKLCHYGTLCKRCLEEVDARANGGGAEGQDGASAIGQPHQGSAESSGPPSVGPGLEAQVESLRRQVEAQEGRIAELERRLEELEESSRWWGAGAAGWQPDAAAAGQWSSWPAAGSWDQRWGAGQSAEASGAAGQQPGGAGAEGRPRAPGTDEQAGAAAAARPASSSWQQQPGADRQHGQGAARGGGAWGGDAGDAAGPGGTSRLQ